MRGGGYLKHFYLKILITNLNNSKHSSVIALTTVKFTIILYFYLLAICRYLHCSVHALYINILSQEKLSIIAIITANEPKQKHLSQMNK